MKKTKPPTPGRTVLYGVHPVLETLRAGKRLVEEVYLAREPAPQWDLVAHLEETGIPFKRVTSNELASMAGSLNHQGLAARVEPFPYADFEEILQALSARPGVVLVLDEIQDPANLGSILRSVECLGGAAVILTKDRAVPVTPAVEKAAAGASAYIPVARVVNLVRAMERLKASGYWIYATDARAKNTCYSTDLTGKLALVLGSESKGIRRLVREKCDAGVAIPMAGKIDSLNVSQTAAILLAESFRQRMMQDAKTSQSGQR